MNLSYYTNQNLVAGQLQSCLTAIGNLTTHLRDSEDLSEGGVPRSSALDGGCKSSLEVSLIKACNRLDSILDNNECWRVPKSGNHDLATAHLTEQVRLCILQRQVMERQIAAQDAKQSDDAAALAFMRSMAANAVNHTKGKKKCPPKSGPKKR